MIYICVCVSSSLSALFEFLYMHVSKHASSAVVLPYQRIFVRFSIIFCFYCVGGMLGVERKSP